MPGLPAGKIPNGIKSIGGKDPAGLFCMFKTQSPDLFLWKIPNAKWLCFDVKGTSTSDDHLLSIRLNSVIPYIPDTTENHRWREMVRPGIISGPDLAENWYQGVSNKSIYLIDVQDER